MLNTNLRVLIIGRGGRESALVEKTIKSPLVKEVYCAPGNAGTSLICKNINIDELNIKELVLFAKENQIDLTIVGPESSLEKGIVDEFQKENLLILGPTKAATVIESSKAFAKKLMKDYNIPTANFEEFTDSKKALDYAQKIEYPHVIKYDGLAQGKGVVICQNFDELKQQIINMLDNNLYGDNPKIILEEFLEGEEFTLLSLVNKTQVYPFEVSRDYKRAFDQDLGENTGGMGSICPFEKISSEQKQEALNILQKTAKALENESRSFCGVLYGGFIATKSGVKVIEYNARFGDPETEVVLQKLESDLIAEILNLLNQKKVHLNNNDNYYLGITLAAKGYPGTYEKGFTVDIPDVDGIYHMGTILDNNQIKSSGGRVLFVTASGKTLEQAKDLAYKKANFIKTKHLFKRNDIGKL